MIHKTRERFGFVAILFCLAILALAYGVSHKDYVLILCFIVLIPLIIYFVKLTLKLDKKEKRMGD